MRDAVISDDAGTAPHKYGPRLSPCHFTILYFHPAEFHDIAACRFIPPILTLPAFYQRRTFSISPFDGDARVVTIFGHGLAYCHQRRAGLATPAPRCFLMRDGFTFRRDAELAHYIPPP